MLGLMVNQASTHIDVSVLVEHQDSRSGTTTRGGNPDAIIMPRQSEQAIESIPAGKSIWVTVQNNEPRDLHFGIVVIDAAGEVSVLFPFFTSDARRLAMDLIPSRQSYSKELIAHPPFGIAELLVLVSPKSLVAPLEKLQLNAPELDKRPHRGAEVASVEAMDDIFGAMDTRRGSETTSAIPGPRLLDVADVAVLSLLFEIVP
jgi:hypothetical protein